MLRFDGLFQISLTAHADTERERAVAIIARLLGAVTRLDGQGLWEGIGEPSVTIQHWFQSDDCRQVWRAVRAARLLQAALRQQAMFLTVQTPRYNVGYVVETPADWADLEEELRPVLEPGLTLADWFVNQGAGN